MTSRRARVSDSSARPASLAQARPMEQGQSADNLSRTLSSFSSLGLPIERLELRHYTETSVFSPFCHLRGLEPCQVSLIFHFDLHFRRGLDLLPYGSALSPPPTLLACHQRDGSAGYSGKLSFCSELSFPIHLFPGKVAGIADFDLAHRRLETQRSCRVFQSEPAIGRPTLTSQSVAPCLALLSSSTLVLALSPTAKCRGQGPSFPPSWLATREMERWTIHRNSSFIQNCHFHSTWC